jgi:hypothetical protein
MHADVTLPQGAQQAAAAEASSQCSWVLHLWQHKQGEHCMEAAV